MMGPEVRGIGRYVSKLIEHLAIIDTKNQYTIFTRPKAAALVPATMRTIITDVPWYGLREQRELPKLFDSTGLDLIHVPHWNAPLRLRTPLIITIHDMILWEHPTLRATTLSPLAYAAKYFAYRYVVSKNAARAKKILTVSQSAANAILRNLKIPAEKIFVTPLGISNNSTPSETHLLDFEEHRAGPTSVSDRAKRNSAREAELSRVPKNEQMTTRPYILTVSSGYPHKNLSTFFRVADELMNRDQTLHAVVCGIDPAFMSRINHQAKQIMGVNVSRLQLLGVIPDAELGALYQNAHVFIFPSLAEGFGLPPLEAAAVGIPIIASNIDTARETLGEAALLVPPTDIQAYLAAYDRLEHEPDLRQQLISKGKARAELFSWQKTAEATLTAYHETFSTP